MMTTARRDGLAILILASGVFTTGLNITALGPLIRPIGEAFGVSDGAVGRLSALHALVAGVAALLVAPAVDRVPRRLVLRGECVLVVLATLVSALAPSYGWLALGRALAGLGGAIIAATCYAYAGDLFPHPGRRNRAIGIVSGAFSLATLAGLPLVTQVAGHADWRWALGTLAIPAGCAALGTFALPGPPRAAGAAGARLDPGRVRAVLGDGRVNWLLAAILLFCLPYAAWSLYLAPFAQTAFAANADALSLLFLAGGIANLGGSLLFPAFLRRGAAPRVYAGLATAVAACLLGVTRLAGPWPVLLPFVVALGIGMIALYLATTTLLLDAMPGARGAVMALQTGTFEVGWALGVSATGGLLALPIGYRGIFALLAPALLLSLACVAMSTARRRAGAIPSLAEQRFAHAGT